ncbi:hypothetical protein ACVWXS_002883 [Lysinibacillus sp. TE18511]
MRIVSVAYGVSFRRLRSSFRHLTGFLPSLDGFPSVA